MSKSTVLVAMLAVAMGLSQALPATGKSSGTETGELMASIYADCLKKDSITCIKYKVFSYIDKVLQQKDDISLSEGITVIKTGNMEEGAPRSIESTDVDGLIFDRLGRFLRTHTVKVDLKGSEILGAIESAGRSLVGDDSAVEARGKKKKAQKLIGPLMMGLAIKTATLIPIALGAIAAIAGKALLVGKIALVISTIIGLKKLLGQKHVTYEVVQHHPHHHEDSHGGYSAPGPATSDFSGYGGGSPSAGGGGGHSSSWARNYAAEMAYTAQKPTTSS